MRDLILALAAIIWLTHRVSKLLKVPVPMLIHILGIDIPEVPKVSIDYLTDSSISIHCSRSQTGGSAVVKYVIHVDGQRVGETDRAESSVTLKNLNPDTEYEIKVSAVNASNYRSHDCSIYVHTKVSSDEGLPSTVDPIVGITAHSGLKRLRDTSSKSTKAGAMKQTTADNKDTDKVYTVEALTTEVEGIQMEIGDLLSQAAAGEAEFLEAETGYLSQLEELKERKRIDDQHRNIVRSESKALEDSKHSIETQRAKLDKQYHQLETEIEKRRTCQENWHQDIAEAKFKIGQLEQSIEQLNDESTREVDNTRLVVSECQREIGHMEDHLKRNTQALRRTEQTKVNVVQALDIFKKNADSITQLVPEKVRNQITESSGLDDYFKEWMEKELELDRNLENEWKKTQKDLEVRYLKAHENYDEANKAFKERQAMSNSTTSIPSIVVNSNHSKNASSLSSVYYRTRAFSTSSGNSGHNRPFQLLEPNASPISQMNSSFAGGSPGKHDDSDELPVNILLPTDLFGRGDDLSESIAKFFKEQRDEDTKSILLSPQQSFLSTRIGDRDSVRLGDRDSLRLGDRDSVRLGDHDSLRLGERDSIRLGDHDSTHLQGSVPNTPNIHLFPDRSRDTTTSSTLSILDNENGHQEDEMNNVDGEKPRHKAQYKKLSSMFFFGRNADHGKLDKQVEKAEMNGTIANTSFGSGDSQNTDLAHTRAASFSSALSKPVSLNPSDSFFSNWKDNSHGGIWNETSNDWSLDGEAKKDDKKLLDGRLPIIESQNTPNKKNRNVFAGIFERTPGPSSPEKVSQRSIASLFGKNDDDTGLPERPPLPVFREQPVNTRNNFDDVDIAHLDESEVGMMSSSGFLNRNKRSFSTKRNASSTNSSKFVRKLNLFSKKEKGEEDINEEENDEQHLNGLPINEGKK